MADNKFNPSKVVPKVGAQDIRNKGWIDEGLPKGYNNHVSSPVIAHTDGKIKPLHESTTDGSLVTKTETIVEYTRIPMVNTAKVEEYIKFQTEPTKSYTTSPAKNFYWWCKPDSQNTGGTHEYGRPHDTGLKNYYQPTDGDMHQHLHEHSPRRNQKMVDTNQEPAVTSRDVWGTSNIFGKEAQPKGSPLTKPSNFMETTADQSKSAPVVTVPAKSHLLPPEVTKAVILLPSIDSREAGKRYAGLPASAVTAYAPAIDSREAAWKYRGQVL